MKQAIWIFKINQFVQFGYIAILIDEIWRQ